jgi:predicted chitinase
MTVEYKDNEKTVVTPPVKDWEAIAKEIWDEYDNVAMFLEQYMSEKMGVQFPFLEKNLSRRFKHFNKIAGHTVTAEEYEKHLEQKRQISEALYKSFSTAKP